MTTPEIRYYTSMALTPEDELSEPEALARGSYNRALLEGGAPRQVEHHAGGSVDFVTYFRETWPNGEGSEASLFDEHARRYGNVSYSVLRQWQTPEGRMRAIFWYDARGVHTQSLESTLKDEQDPLRDVYRDAQGNITSIVEFEYDESGERLRERHLRADGSLWFVQEYDD